MTADQLVQRPLFLVASAGQQAGPVAPFVCHNQEPADEPEALTSDPASRAILAAIAAANAAWRSDVAALTEAVERLTQEVAAVDDRLRRALNGDDTAGPV